MAEDGELIRVPRQPPDVQRYNADVPGKLAWFEPGSAEYQRWVSQRNEFIGEIDTERGETRALFYDIVDMALESEAPTGIFSAIAVALKVTKTARMKQKRRQIWYELISRILQWTFTPPVDQDHEFVFSFFQVQHLLRGAGGGALSKEDYKRIYSTIHTELCAGKLKDKIIRFPELDRYIAYKLRQFKDSFHRYQLSLIEY